MTAMLSPAGVRLDEHRLACAALTYLAEPDDKVLGALLQAVEPAEMLAAIKAGKLPARLAAIGTASKAGTAPETSTVPVGAILNRAMERWQVRLPDLPDDDNLARICREGVRLACPDDPEWPSRLDTLGTARPYALWLRGNADLELSCLRSVSMVGSRAATGYGAHVAGEIAADLSERGWVIVSGGAYGIDAAVHRGALITGGTTIAVLACGVDHPYPAGHADLFAAIANDGLVISEWPPGSRPTRLRFLIRNRVISALSCGTVIVEAGQRSGALNTARHAAELGRPLMAVPGPVTSAQSAGCHKIIRDWNGGCVTCAADIVAMLTPLGEGLVRDAAPMRPGDALPARPDDAAPARPGAALPVLPDSGPSALSRDDLDIDSARVLDAFPARSGIGMSTIAVKAGLAPATVLASVGRLAACGFIEPCAQGWRLTRKAYKLDCINMKHR
jgi:DNA processing protein